MDAFARLFAMLDCAAGDVEKVAALEEYFRRASPADAAWGLWLLLGRGVKRVVKYERLQEWAAAEAGLPMWLVAECYEHVGDLAEALAWLLPPKTAAGPPPLAVLIEERLLPLGWVDEVGQRSILRTTWSELNPTQRLVWHKLITGNLRVGVPRALLVRALAGLAKVEDAVMAYRLMGDWRPTAGEFMQLVQSETAGGSPARPYPFCLATPLDRDLASLGEPSEWLCERMWDGIRAQLVRRSGETFLWSTGQELIGAVFPEVVAAGRTLPDGTVLDGALIAWPAEGPMPSTEPQRRLVRRAPGATPRRGVPVVFLAYDLLEVAGQDSRQWPLTKRREALETVINGAVAEKARSGERPTQGGCAQRELFGDLTPAPAMSTLLRLSPAQAVGVWGELKQGQARGRGSGPEGWLLRRLDAPYGAGQQHDDWWTWKLGPLTCHAVLVAAQPGQGRNASLFVDYTFSVWQGRELVSVARSELGLSDAENEAIDAFVRTHTTGRFGPVRWVVPELVFELAFDGLAGSRRHKAGFSLLCPRIVRWRRDKRPEEADAVETLRALAQGERV